MPRLTITEVQQARDALRARQQPVTVISIRNALGHGSYSTITRLLKELQESGTADAESAGNAAGNTAGNSASEKAPGDTGTAGARGAAAPPPQAGNHKAEENTGGYLPDILSEKNRELERLRNRELSLTGLVLRNRREITGPLNDAIGILRYFLRRTLDEGFAAEIPGDLIRLLRMLREHGSLNGLQDHAGSFQDDTERLMRAMLLRNSRRNDKQKTGAPDK